MKDFTNWLDNAPFIIQLLFSLPILNFIYGIYRALKGLQKNNILLIIVGIIWIFAGAAIFWIIDLISVILYKKPVVLVG
ncbi:MAG TPA: hypothetical protein VJ845_03910 [Haploplasma sp.]|nr:hypothetical protein [Haploplasma sp.]